MADAFTAPASRLHVIPDSLSDAQAALVEPLSTAVHAVRMAGPLAGAAVAVLGAGTIGLLTVIAAARAGARAVAVSEPRDNKRQRALRLGAAFCAGPLAADPAPAMRRALGGHADVTFDCVSSQASTAQAKSPARCPAVPARRRADPLICTIVRSVAVAAGAVPNSRYDRRMAFQR